MVLPVGFEISVEEALRLSLTINRLLSVCMGGTSDPLGHPPMQYSGLFVWSSLEQTTVGCE